jgi:hypothetical protein
VGAVIPYQQHGQDKRPQRWERLERAELFARYGARQKPGTSQRQAATVLDVPRRTLQAWRAAHERLDAWPAVGACVHRVPGRAFLHRLVLAFHLVGGEGGACGMRLGWLVVRITGRNRCVGASSGTPPQGNRRVDAALVASRQAASARWGHDMPPKALTLTPEETVTGGRCGVGSAPVRHAIGGEPAAQARAHDTWQELRAQGLAGRTWQGLHAPSAAAPGRLAAVDQPLGAPPSPDLFHGQHALRKAVSAPLAPTQGAAAPAVATAAERLARVHEPLQGAKAPPDRRRPGRPPPAAPRVAPAPQAVEAARQAHQRLTQARAQGRQGMRAIGHAAPGVALERGGRRNGTRLARDLHEQSYTLRPLAQQAGRRQTCRERREQAARGVPHMPATSACVAGEVRPPGSPLDWAPPPSDSRPAPLMPAEYLERVAATRTVPQGEPLRALAERRRTPRGAPGGA